MKSCHILLKLSQVGWRWDTKPWSVMLPASSIPTNDCFTPRFHLAAQPYGYRPVEACHKLRLRHWEKCKSQRASRPSHANLQLLFLIQLWHYCIRKKKTYHASRANLCNETLFNKWKNYAFVLENHWFDHCWLSCWWDTWCREPRGYFWFIKSQFRRQGTKIMVKL